MNKTSNITSPAGDELQEKLAAKARAPRKRDAAAFSHARGRDKITPRNDLRPAQRVEEVAPGDLSLPVIDVRRQDRAHIAELADSIRQFGFVGHVLINAERQVLDGVSLVHAAKLLQLSTIPCVQVEHLTPAQERSLRISLNRLQEKGGWDLDVLQVVVSELVEIDEPVLGFDEAEIDMLVEDTAAQDDEPQTLTVGTAPARCQLGTLALLGPHRVFCADAKDPRAYEVVMQGEKARVVITDPPFNVLIQGHVCGMGKRTHREFMEASGEMGEAQYRAFLEHVLGSASNQVVPGGLLGVFIDWRHVGVLLGAGERVGLQLINVVVWSKTNAGMGSLWRSAHELMPWFKAGSEPHVNNVQLGRYGRARTNVWEYPGASSLGSEAREGLADHPTVKSRRMIAEAVLDVTNRGEVVLDPFLGSGTTLLAAERTGRRCFGLELDPLYMDVIVQRWEEETGKQAVLEDAAERLEAYAEQDAPGRERDRAPDALEDDLEGRANG